MVGLGKKEVCSFKVRMCSLQFPILAFFSKKRNVANLSAQVQCKILKVRIMFFNDMTETFFNLEHSTKLKTKFLFSFCLFLTSLFLCVYYIYIYTHTHIHTLLCLFLNYHLDLKCTELYYVFCSNPL